MISFPSPAASTPVEEPVSLLLTGLLPRPDRDNPRRPGSHPLRRTDSESMPWIPSPVPGKASRPLRFLRDNRGFVELLRMEPGVAMPPHRHTGETHAFNLTGSRQLSSGEVIGPGGYVYEPPGNIDAWRAIGDEPLIALVVVMGQVEELAPDGHVRGIANAATRFAEYETFCREHGIAMLDLVE